MPSNSKRLSMLSSHRKSKRDSKSSISSMISTTSSQDGQYVDLPFYVVVPDDIPTTSSPSAPSIPATTGFAEMMDSDECAWGGPPRTKLNLKAKVSALAHPSLPSLPSWISSRRH